MQVAQFPCSHENGGLRPARRAASRMVSPGSYPTRVLAAVEPDHDRLRLGFLAGRGCLVGQLEPLDEQPTRIDPSLLEAGLDDLHVRPGAADVEVGLRPVPDQRRARRGIEEPRLRVEVMMHREAAAGCRAQAFELRRRR